MKDWILQRAKAFVGALVAGMIPVVIAAFESAVGFEIPADIKSWIMITVGGLATGWAVYQVPNKPMVK